MPASTQDRIRKLNELLQLALEDSQVEVYGARSLIYHGGFYSNRTSLWSHSPTLLEKPDRGYLITATPKSALRLAVLAPEAIAPTLPATCQESDNLACGLLELCELIGHYCPVSGLDGFALTPLEGGNHYRHIVLFRPLDALNLYDMEPL
ncbi:hypothetical protein GCM10011348_09630 [Marinobacterium nitratireducens]|uniref:Uncharacterized protein n=1 Tax=Marinobacterium nitratireducens TaxID=518897 RepID=A0A917Z982_9GAMM|nr:hypothetical protein [Marinobacterium nitratireducens]GGO78225.1 hypothetical protein GCM10011348_09630 [Marinobacterium nitratireducens]